MGPYCFFCQNRCFILVDGLLRATCGEGKVWDRMVDLIQSVGCEYKSVHEVFKGRN